MKYMPLEEIEIYEEMQQGLIEQNKDQHNTVSAIVLDPSRKFILLIYHKKYNSWSWIGGHVEKDENFLKASNRELCEETGLCNEMPLYGEPISCDILQGIDHIHYNLTYFYSIPMEKSIVLNEQETKGIRWFLLEDMWNHITEEKMIPLYQKIINRIFLMEKDSI